MCVILIHNVILGVVCNEVRFMLNEERIKHMTKLAIYESQGGNKDLKAGLQYKKRYVAVNTFWAALWMTMAYIAMVIFGNLYYFINSVHSARETYLRQRACSGISSHEKFQRRFGTIRKDVREGGWQ